MQQSNGSNMLGSTKRLVKSDSPSRLESFRLDIGAAVVAGTTRGDRLLCGKTLVTRQHGCDLAGGMLQGLELHTALSPNLNL